MSQFVVTWHDSGRQPTNRPDPKWPNGIDLDLSHGRADCCTVELPYPARRIGTCVVRCTICLLRTVCTTAGRLDDPRSLTMACGRREGDAA